MSDGIWPLQISAESDCDMQVRSWQASLLMHCCTVKQAVLCNNTSTDSRFVPAMDGCPTGLKVHNTLLVPWLTSTGSCMGVLQVRNLALSPCSSPEECFASHPLLILNSYPDEKVFPGVQAVHQACFVSRSYKRRCKTRGARKPPDCIHLKGPAATPRMM